MKRQDALGWLRIAGYHGDQAQFTRIYVENRVSYPVAIGQYREGARLKAVGMKCSCSECKRTEMGFTNEREYLTAKSAVSVWMGAAAQSLLEPLEAPVNIADLMRRIKLYEGHGKAVA
jgi:hypothetical protein